MKILNLSNHVLTEEQIAELKEKGLEIVELNPNDKKIWGQLNPENFLDVTDNILEKHNDCEVFHLAGFPAAVTYAVQKLKQQNKKAVYSYSERNTVEKNINGEIVKTAIFKHKGFFEYI